MKKIANKKAAVLLTCLVVALAGCGEADKTDTTPTPVPTTEAATAPTQTPEATLPEPTNEPSAATQTPTPEPAATSTPENTTPPANPVVTVTNVEIESMEIQDEHTIVVTLNGALKNANPEELSFSTYIQSLPSSP